MATVNDTETLELQLTVRSSVTVLPRCLQVLSRRGFVLLELSTEQTENAQMVLHCTINGPVRWHEPLVRLLERLVDVERVTVKESKHA
jgi:acetolactate synthase regulatory subunit